MQGRLSQVPLPEVLQFLAMSKPTGRLRLNRTGIELVLTVREGRIIGSSTLNRRRQLGELLVHRGLLRRSQLAQILHLQKTEGSDKQLGQLLIEHGLVEPADINELLQLQVEEDVWEVFAWGDGEFYFEVAPAESLGDPIVHIELEPLIIEGARRNDEWRAIRAILPDESVVLAVEPLGEEYQRNLQLTPEEWKVLALVNGLSTVRAIVNRSTLSAFQVQKTLSQFVRSGLISFADSPMTAAEEPEAPAASAPAARGGLLGRVMGGASRRTESAPRGQTPGEFESPASLLAWVLKDFCERALRSRDFTPAPPSSQFLARTWYQSIQKFPKADMIASSGNDISTDDLEKAFAQCEYGPVIDEVYEDCIEGLLAALGTARAEVAQRANAKTAARILKETLQHFESRTVVRHRGPFNLAERVQRALET